MNFALDRDELHEYNVRRFSIIDERLICQMSNENVFIGCGENSHEPSMYEFTLAHLQEQQKAWQQHNFPDREDYCPLLGAMEELGELAHAHLKSHQKTRGSAKKHHAAKIDAVADTVIFLSDYCTANGIDFQQAVVATWQKVRQRDYKASPHGTKFKKKPVVISAEQWQPGKQVEGVDEIDGQAVIKTLEGPMRVSAGDWVITGVQGEKYACKADIFELTYERVD